MKGLPKASKARVMFLTLPKEVETEFDTGYGDNNNSNLFAQTRYDYGSKTVVENSNVKNSIFQI